LLGHLHAQYARYLVGRSKRNLRLVARPALAGGRTRFGCDNTLARLGQLSALHG
jgi:hypothetical protein